MIPQFSEDDYLQLSGIQHFRFCPRQWALIHIEEQWVDNYLTVSGEIFHDNVHEGSNERRGDKIMLRGLKVSSAKLGISGECDVVELHRDPNGISLPYYSGTYIPFPVEYKRGEPKVNDCDRLQLCAQALCLEEMLCCDIREGAIFYGEPRRREIVCFSADLRNNLYDTLQKMHSLYEKRHTPNAEKGTHCNNCSLKDICLPRLSSKTVKNVQRYLEDGLL